MQQFRFNSLRTLAVLFFCVMGACTEKEDAAPIVSADFTANETTLEQNSDVRFTDQSTGEPTGWEWAFEGGEPATSTAQHPNISYPNSGTFNVSLRVTNGYNEDTELKDGYITIFSSVAGGFSADERVVPIGASVSFADESAGEPTSWSWIFEGAEPASSTEQNPIISYPGPGTYSVILKVSNAHTENTLTETGYIRVYEPVVAAFTTDVTEILEGGLIQFSDASSGNPTQWNWTFEGGTPATSTDQNPVVLYNNPGEFGVTLNVSHIDHEDTEAREAVVLVEAGETDSNGGSEENAEIIFDVVETMPTPVGGMTAWNKYLAENMQYPKEAVEQEIEGTVFVRFVVETDGNLTSLEITKGIGGGCDEEALRLIREAPKWEPGTQRGGPVRVRMRLSIRFRLNEVIDAGGGGSNGVEQDSRRG